MAWKLPMGTSNCTRCLAYSMVVCNNQRAVPTSSAASATVARSSQASTSAGVDAPPGGTSTSNVRRDQSTDPTWRTLVGVTSATPADDTATRLSTRSASSTNVLVGSSFATHW